MVRKIGLKPVEARSNYTGEVAKILLTNFDLKGKNIKGSGMKFILYDCTNASTVEYYTVSPPVAAIKALR